MTFENPLAHQEYLLMPAAKKRAEETIAQKSIGHEMDDFVDPYTEAGVAADKLMVSQYEEAFAAALAELPPEKRERKIEAQEMARIFEGIMINQKSWFGMNADIFPTSRFDDIKHGVDAIIQHKIGDAYSHNGVAIDVTFAGPKPVFKKLEKRIDQVRKGHLSTVKYFHSPEAGIRGQLSEIPAVVVGASGDTMQELVNLFASHEDGKLSSHPVQFQILDQIKTQCDFFIELAEKENVPNKEKIIAAYQKLGRQVDSVLKQKNLVYKDPAVKNIRDSFHEHFLEILAELKLQTREIV